MNFLQRWFDRSIFLFLSVGVSLGHIKASDNANTNVERIDALADLVSGIITEKGTAVRVKGSYTGFNGGKEIPSAKYSFSTTFVVGDDSRMIVEIDNYETPNSKGGFVSRKVSFIREGDTWYEFLYGFNRKEGFSAARSARKLSAVPPSLGAGSAVLGSGIASIPNLIVAYSGKTLSELLSYSGSEKRFVPTVKTTKNEVSYHWKDICSESELTFVFDHRTLVEVQLQSKQNLCSNPKQELSEGLKWSEFSNSPLVHAGKIEKVTTFDGAIQYKSFIQIANVQVISGNSTAFKVPELEPGWTVQDSVLGIDYVTGKNPEQTLESIRVLFE